MSLPIDQSLMDRYFQNACTQEEARQVVAWLAQAHNDLYAKCLMAAQWENPDIAELKMRPNLDAITQRLEQQLGFRVTELPA